MEVFDAAQLQRAIKELKDSTRVTMETVGVRFCRRVSTALYREHLLRSPGTRDPTGPRVPPSARADRVGGAGRAAHPIRAPQIRPRPCLQCSSRPVRRPPCSLLLRAAGDVILQPPSEDRVSAFVSVSGAKPTCLKFFSTGKVRCLKSDFANADDALRIAQDVIDAMAAAADAGMPPIRLRDAKFNENAKDFTWSTRQTIDIRRLSAALRHVGIKAESDTSFGDSIMVVITPGSLPDRQIKGQVLADGTIRLAGCRDDGEQAAHAMAASLNASGALQGGPVDADAVRLEVWLTKRCFHVCTEHQSLNMDRLCTILGDARLSQCSHPVLEQWVRHKSSKNEAGVTGLPQPRFIKTVHKVGTACPRLEVKFSPLVIEEWEQERRCKPEPVSISIHHKGEVQLAGNAEYKVLQAVYFLSDIVSRYRSELVSALLEDAAQDKGHLLPARTPKRKLDVKIDGGEGHRGSEWLLSPPERSALSSGHNDKRAKTETPCTTLRGTKKTPLVSADGATPQPAALSYLHAGGGLMGCTTARWEASLPPLQSGAAPLKEEETGESFHQRQLVLLTLLRLCPLASAPAAGADCVEAAGAPHLADALVLATSHDTQPAHAASAAWLGTPAVVPTAQEAAGASVGEESHTPPASPPRENACDDASADAAALRRQSPVSPSKLLASKAAALEQHCFSTRTACVVDDRQAAAGLAVRTLLVTDPGSGV